MKSATLRMRLWREKNRQRARNNERRWRKNNLSKARAKCRRWYWRNREKELARSATYAKKNHGTVAARVRLHNRGLTQQQHDEMLKKQNNSCAICKTKFTDTPHIDHSHGCCEPRYSCEKCRRGLLCTDCNLGIGRFKDSIALLSNAIQYLKEYQQ